MISGRMHRECKNCPLYVPGQWALPEICRKKCPPTLHFRAVGAFPQINRENAHSTFPCSGHFSLKLARKTAHSMFPGIGHFHPKSAGKTAHSMFPGTRHFPRNQQEKLPTLCFRALGTFPRNQQEKLPTLETIEILTVRN